MMTERVFLDPSCSSGIVLESRHQGPTQDRYEHNLSNYSMTFRFSKFAMYSCCTYGCKKKKKDLIGYTYRIDLSVYK